MISDTVEVGIRSTFLSDANRAYTTSTERVIEALIRLVGVDRVIDELTKTS